MPEWRKQRIGVEDMTVAVMGCVVNGPGESKHANIGISLPGTGEHPVAPVYEDGAKTVTLKGDRIAEEFQELVERYIERTYTRNAYHVTAAGRKRNARPARAACRRSTPAEAAALAQQLHPRLEDCHGLQEPEASLKFKDFYRTMSFVNALAHIANIEDHHPDLEVGYDYCRVTYSTHAIGGLSRERFHLRGQDRPPLTALMRNAGTSPADAQRALREAGASGMAAWPTAPSPARAGPSAACRLENSRSNPSSAAAASRLSLLRQRS